MRDKDLEKTQKALEELVKVEYQAIAAYDEGIAETEDSKLRRQYTRFRNDHEKQARDLNNRLAELGGEPVEYGVGTGKVQGGLLGQDHRPVRRCGQHRRHGEGAEDGIRIYLSHLDDIHDSKALSHHPAQPRSQAAGSALARGAGPEATRKTAARTRPRRPQKVQKTAEEMGKKSDKKLKDVQKQGGGGHQARSPRRPASSACRCGCCLRRAPARRSSSCGGRKSPTSAMRRSSTRRPTSAARPPKSPRPRPRKAITASARAARTAARAPTPPSKDRRARRLSTGARRGGRAGTIRQAPPLGAALVVAAANARGGP